MRPDAMRPRSRPRPERVRLRPRPNDLASRPHGPPGLNITVVSTCIVVSSSLACTKVVRPKAGYDTILYEIVRSKADMSHLNLPHGTDN